LSDLSGCSCVLKALISKLLRWPSYSRSLIRSFLFVTCATPLKKACRETRFVTMTRQRRTFRL
jgi:hypothetical protein